MPIIKTNRLNVAFYDFFCDSILRLNHFCFHNFQKITEQKLQAFAIGTMGQRPLSRREQEEKRKKEEEEAAAHVREITILPYYPLLLMSQFSNR